MIRLIISDIDGTLVPEGACSINPEYMDVIRRLTDLGVTFAAASGRQASSVDAIFHEIRDHIYYLADNGAYIQKNGRPAKEVRMNKKDLEQLIAEVRKFPGCHALLSTREGYFIDDKSEAFYKLVFEQYKGTGAVVENIMDYTDACIKLSLYGDNGSQELYDRLDDRWKSRFSVNISGAKWMDINDFHATKGNAVRWIQERSGITPEETVTFGDNFNDISMLERSVRSYVSVLSHPDVKKAARYEAASYKEDGVLQVLKQILEEIQK